MRRGVYAIIHVRTGAAYIGSSVNMTNRFTWHRHMLRRGEHRSLKLQALWDKTEEHEWVFAVIQFCRSLELRDCEEAWMKKWPGKLLNDRDVEWRHSQETRAKMRLGRMSYLETPGAREALSARAKKQHAEGRFR